MYKQFPPRPKRVVAVHPRARCVRVCREYNSPLRLSPVGIDHV